MKIKLIGLDPSLRNFGVSIGFYDTVTKSLEITNGFVICSKPNHKKLTQANQDVLTTKSIFTELSTHIVDCDYWTAELPTGSQSSRAMASYGICIGIIGSLVVSNPNFISCTPYDVKKVVGIKTTDKEQIINWVTHTYPNILTWLPKAKNKQEHICDSIVAMHLLVHNPKFTEYVNENYPISNRT